MHPSLLKLHLIISASTFCIVKLIASFIIIYILKTFHMDLEVFGENNATSGKEKWLLTSSRRLYYCMEIYAHLLLSWIWPRSFIYFLVYLEKIRCNDFGRKFYLLRICFIFYFLFLFNCSSKCILDFYLWFELILLRICQNLILFGIDNFSCVIVSIMLMSIVC